MGQGIQVLANNRLISCNFFQLCWVWRLEISNFFFAIGLVFSKYRKWNNWFCINRAPLFWRIMLLCCREGWQRVWWPEPCMYQSLSGSYWWKNSSSSLNLVKYLQPLSSWWLYARLSNIHHKLWLQHWWILVWNLLHFLASSWID